MELVEEKAHVKMKWGKRIYRFEKYFWVEYFKKEIVQKEFGKFIIHSVEHKLKMKLIEEATYALQLK